MIDRLRFIIFYIVAFLPLFRSASNNALLAEALPESVVDTQLACQILERSLMSLFSGEFGFVLLGVKPAAIAESSNYYLCTNSESLNQLLQFLRTTFQGSTRFIVKTFADGEYYRIEFINKQALRKKIYENYELQSFVTTRFGDLNTLFEKLSSADETLFDVFEDPFLIGLVLGYGRANSEYYCRRCAIGDYLKKYPIVCLLPFNPEPHKSYAISRNFKLRSLENDVQDAPITKGFDSLEDEWSWIREVGWNLENDCAPVPPHYISLPFYICRYGGDSEQVRYKYLKARDSLAELFYNCSFTEAILTESRKN